MKKIIKIETMEPKKRLRIEYMAGNYCNFKCNYCGPWANGGDVRWPKDFDMLVKHFRHLLNFYVRNGRDEFEINILGGEPSLWPDIIKFARIIKSEYNAKITMSSNGSRTLRWWDENADAFDKILFSYHHTEADLKHYINVLDLVYNKGIAINGLILMDPNYWDEIIAAMDIMKATSQNSWFICAMEVHPPKYTQEQREIFKKHVKRRPPIFRLIKNEYDNILKGKTTVIFDDGSKKKVERNYFSINDLNNFEGWMCNIGIENLNIKADGKLTGTCDNRLFDENIFYNLYDPKFTENFNPKLIPTVCEKDKCWCQPEMLMTKWKI
jgi:organic radical activating enzyme